MTRIQGFPHHREDHEVKIAQGENSVTIEIEASRKPRTLYVLGEISIFANNTPWLVADLYINDMDNRVERKAMVISHDYQTTPHDFIHIAVIEAGQPAIIKMRNSRGFLGEGEKRKLNIQLTAITINRS